MLKRFSELAIVVLMVCDILPMIVGAAEVRGYGAPLSPVNSELSSEPIEANLTSLIVLVFVNSTIYNDVKTSLDQYRNDLKQSGFEDAIVLNWSEPDPALVRETLQQFHSNSSLAGALLVGDMPTVEYEMFTEWDYERFPTDLYYMDLDGDWLDKDDDGVFDGHEGKMKLAPEIWVGRIKTSNLGGDEASLINNYFTKNHNYREGSTTPPRRALIYIDDEWVNFANMDENSVRLLYNETTVVTGKATTNAEDFKKRLQQGYEWVHLRSHGSWYEHHFWASEGDGGIIYSTEYAEIDPNALFYQLFVCRSARYTKPNYLAGSIVFKTTQGLLAIGSTKLGSMLMYWTFYEAIAEGRTVGDAFQKWFTKWGEGRFGMSETGYIGRKWFYGLTIIGDPTLRLRWLGEREIAELQKREEEAVNDLPLVRDLRQQVDSLEENHTTLQNSYDDLKTEYSALQRYYNNLETHLLLIGDLLYFFLLTTTILLVISIYLMKSRPKLDPSVQEVLLQASRSRASSDALRKPGESTESSHH